MKKWLKRDWPILLILLAPFVIIAMYWNQFPDQLPGHYDINGEVDRYDSKAVALFIGPGINLLMYFLFIVLPKIDPKKANYALFQDRYHIIRTVLHLFIFGMFLMTVFTGLGYDVDVKFIVPNAVIILFLVLGNYMGTIRHNYFLGVKTPWTLANEEVWRLTHRFTGKLWVVASVLMLVYNLIFGVHAIVFVAYVILIAVVPMIYSYIMFKKLQNNAPGNNT